MNKALSISVVAASLLMQFPAVLAAQDVDENLIVTATRTSQSIDETLAAVSLLTRSDIERLQSPSLAELMSHLPGINISNQGGIGAASGIFIRGAETDHTLILIDGVRSGSATLGSTSIQYLSPDQIERIEVVRGPKASLYGSDAVGGVVQIFTKKGQQDFSPSISVGVGSDNTEELAVGLDGSFGSTRFSVTSNYYNTDGFSRKDTEGVDADDDAYRNTAISANIEHRLENGGDIRFSVSRQEGESEYDGWSPVYTEFEIRSFSAGFRVPVTNVWTTSLNLGRFVDDNVDTSDDPDYLWGSRVKTTRNSLSWQNDLQLTESQLLSLGLDRFDDTVDSSIHFAKDEVSNKAVFIQYQAEFGRIRTVLGARNDDHEAFGSHTTLNVSVGFDLSESLVLAGSYGSAFKAPTLNDLYYDVPFAAHGNPDLNPEESETFDIALKGFDSFVDQWSVSVFRTQIDDLIVWESDPLTWELSPRNITDAAIDGLELELVEAIADWRIAAAITLLDHEDRDTHDPLARRADETLSLDIDRSYGRLSWGLSLIAQGERYDYDFFGNQTELGGYSTVALRGSYKVNKEVSLQLKIGNLFDKNYQLADTYNTDGLNAMFSVTYTP